MRKLKLLLMACALFGAGTAWAQDNLLAGWDGGDDTSSPSNFGWSSSENRTLQPRNNNGDIRMTTTYSGYKLEDGTEYSYSATSDPSSVIFWVRYNKSGESFTYTFQGLEPDSYYDFSGLVGWHNNSNAPTFTVKLNDGTNDLATMSKYVSTKQTLYQISSRFKTPSTMTTTTDVNLVFTCNQTNDCMEAISALSLVKVNIILKDDLEAAISYATMANAYLSSSDLATAIAAAQSVFNNAAATQSDVNNAEATLNAAVTAAVNANPLTLINPGFESTTPETINWAAAGSNNSANYVATGWMSNGGAAWSSSAVVAYGGEGQVNGVSAPSADNGGNSGNALGVSVGWEGTVTYQSVTPITLPMGYYTLTVYGNNQNSGVTQFKSLNGFVTTGGTSHLSTKRSFAYGTWEADEVKFTLTEATEGRIQIGGQAISGGSGDNAKVFFDNITLSYKSFEEAWTENKAAAQTVLDDATYAAITGAERTAVTVAIAATPSTAAEYESAFTALEAAVNAFTASLGDYAVLANEKAKAKALGLTDEAIDAVATIDNTAIQNTQALKVAEYNYVTTNYAYGVALNDSWNSTGTNTSAATFSNEHWSGETHDYMNQNDTNGQGWNASSWTLDFNQDVTLPAGSYVFKVAGRRASGDNIVMSLVVKQGETILGTVSDFPEGNSSRGINKSGATAFVGEDSEFANGGKGYGWEWRYVKFDLDALGTVNIGVHAEATAYNQWISFGDYTLQATNADVATLLAALGEYDAALSAANTAIANTDYENVTGQERSTLNTAIGADATLNKSSLTDVQAATTALTSATTAFTAAKETYDDFVTIKANAIAAPSLQSELLNMIAPHVKNLPMGITLPNPITYAYVVACTEATALANSLQSANGVDLTTTSAEQLASVLETLRPAYNNYMDAAPKCERAWMAVAIAYSEHINLDDDPTLKGQVQTLGTALYLKLQSAAALEVSANNIFTGLVPCYVAAAQKKFGFDEGEYAPYENADGIEALYEAQAIGEDPTNYDNEAICNVVDKLLVFAWKQNTEDVDAVYNGLFSEGDNGLKGWKRTNAWGQQQTGLSGDYATAYYNQPGSLVYGTTGAYVMPLAANTIYKLTVAFRSHEDNSNNALTVSVLNENNEGLAATNVGWNKSKTEWKVVSRCFKTGEAGSYVLTLANDGNTWMTGVSIVKAEVIDIAINENESYNPAEEKAANVTFNRTFAAGWNGAVLPFNMTADEVKTAFNASAVKDFAGVIVNEDGSAKLNFEDATEVKAGRPFVMKNSEAGTSYTIDGVILPATDLQTVTKENGNVKYVFTGSYAATTDLTDVNFALINGGKFYYHTAGNNESSAKAFRAWFVNESTDPEGARVSFNFGDEVVTGIENVNANDNANDNVYNLQGQRVVNAKKGLFIQNGKKVMVK